MNKNIIILKKFRNFTRLLIRSLWLICLFFLFISQSFADSQAQVETAFIYQFTNYIQWPPTSEENFIISVLGSSALTKELEELAKIKTAKGKKISVHSLEDPGQLKRSDLVILANSNEKHLEEICRKTKSGGTLIVSFSKGFAQKCAMINFYLEEERIRFEINRSTLENAKLQASSQLLKLAKIIE